MVSYRVFPPLLLATKPNALQDLLRFAHATYLLYRRSPGASKFVWIFQQFSRWSVPPVGARSPALAISRQAEIIISRLLRIHGHKIFINTHHSTYSGTFLCADISLILCSNYKDRMTTPSNAKLRLILFLNIFSYCLYSWGLRDLEGHDVMITARIMMMLAYESCAGWNIWSEVT